MSIHRTHDGHCYACKKPRPCPVVLEDRIPHGTVAGYNHGCRCDDCRTAKVAARGTRNHRPLAPLNDGIVDWVVVERLLRREMPPADATVDERKAAAAKAFAYAWDDAYVYAQDYLRLRSTTIKAVRADLRTWLAVAS